MFGLHRSPVVLVVLVVMLGVDVLAGPSRAATPEALQHARELFFQAEADEDAERWSEAIDKFRAVSQVRLTAGVRYHLALCEQHLGQLARALKDYRAAEQQARLDNARDVLQSVGRELAALDPRVPRLTIRVAPALAGTSVRLDGETVAEASGSGGPFPVDPGVHYVEVRAPDRATATQGVVLHEGESRTLDITLALPTSSPTTTSTAPPSETRSSQAAETPAPPPLRTNRAAALVATALSAGLAGGGVAAFFLAGGAHEHALHVCASYSTPPDSCDYLKAPVRAWDFAAAGSWVGALAAGVVAVVLWTKHDPTSGEAGPSGTRAVPARTGVLIRPAPLGVEGQF